MAASERNHFHFETELFCHRSHIVVSAQTLDLRFAPAHSHTRYGMGCLVGVPSLCLMRAMCFLWVYNMRHAGTHTIVCLECTPTQLANLHQM